MKGSDRRNLGMLLRERQQGRRGMSMPGDFIAQCKLTPSPEKALLGNALAGDIKALIQIVDLLAHYDFLPEKFFSDTYKPEYLPLAYDMYSIKFQDRRILSFLKGLSKEIIYRLNIAMADRSIQELVDFERCQNKLTTESALKQIECYLMLNQPKRFREMNRRLTELGGIADSIIDVDGPVDLTYAKTYFDVQFVPHCSLLGAGWACAKQQEVPVGVSVIAWASAQLIVVESCMSCGNVGNALRYLQRVSLMTHGTIVSILTSFESNECKRTVLQSSQIVNRVYNYMLFAVEAIFDMWLGQLRIHNPFIENRGLPSLGQIEAYSAAALQTIFNIWRNIFQQPHFYPNDTNHQLILINVLLQMIIMMSHNTHSIKPILLNTLDVDSRFFDQLKSKKYVYGMPKTLSRESFCNNINIIIQLLGHMWHEYKMSNKPSYCLSMFIKEIETGIKSIAEQLPSDIKSHMIQLFLSIAETDPSKQMPPDFQYPQQTESMMSSLSLSASSSHQTQSQAGSPSQKRRKP